MVRAAAEKRTFKPHPKLLMDVITRQAGTLAKAMLEGVMNSIDAGAKRCDVVLNAAALEISDDGKGMTDRAQIEHFFEVFGQPHDESEGKRYGTFRMGRGQLFAFGKNRWRTGPFEMEVDIQSRGLDYDLHTLDEPAAGCTVKVELYKRLLPSELADAERTIRRWVRYAGESCEVYVNGELASSDPSGEKWDYTTPEAYVRLNQTSAIEVYNLGVHCLDLSKYRYGLGGVVVSRKQLKVNFARNDIQADCPVWLKVKRLIDQNATARSLKAPRLDDAGRARLVEQFAAGDLTYEEFRDRKVIQAVNGRHYSLDQLERHCGYGKAVPLMAAPLRDLKADQVHSQALGAVLSDNALEAFGMKLPKLVAFLNKARRDHERRCYGEDSPPDEKFVAGDLAEATKSFSGEFVPLADKDLTKREKAWKDLAETAAWEIASALNRDRRGRRDTMAAIRQSRKITIGKDESGATWTDGRTFVGFSRGYLADVDFGVEGLYAVALTVLREMAHDDPTGPEQNLGPDYLQAVVDAAGCLGLVVKKMRAKLTNVLKRHGLERSRRVLKDEDIDAVGSAADGGEE